jgi:hypothetical protein
MTVSLGAGACCIAACSERIDASRRRVTCGDGAPTATRTAAPGARRPAAWAALSKLLALGTLLVVVAGGAEARVITIDWSSPESSAITGFRIYTRTASQSFGAPAYDGKPRAVAGVYSIQLTASDVEGTYVAATAYNSAGESARSNELFYAVQNGLVDTSNPDVVVGTGTPASCNETALANALAVGGVITFDCGAAPVSIPISSAKPVTHDTVLDGEGLVTLDGGGTTRILSVPSSFELGTPTLTVQRLTFTRGSSVGVAGDDTERSGGAIWVRGGSLHVVACSFTDNHAPATGQDVAGGAIYDVGSGDVTIVGSTFIGNGASNGGAIGILHADLTIAGTTIAENAATGSGGNPGNGGNGGGVYIDGVSQTVSLDGVQLEDNAANAYGGGLFRVSNDGVGVMAIDHSSVLGNTIPDQSPSMAGGLYLQGVQIDMNDTTIAWNQARSAGGVFVGPGGTTLQMTNVTLAENTALSSLAGGIAISSGVTGEIRNATIARNAAPGAVAFAGATTGGAQVVLRNTIVADSVAGNAYNPISCLATFLEGDGNLQWPVARAGGGSDVPGALCSASVDVIDAKLGALRNNGGPTLTIRPAADSPAIAVGASCPERDQRGTIRPVGTCTAGAVEPVPEAGATLMQSAAFALLLALSARDVRRRRAR